MFDQMTYDIKTDVVKFLMNARKREENLQRTTSVKITGEGFEDETLRNLDGYAPRKSGGNNTVVNTQKVGRNELCPCGSGKKYKNCCGRNQ